MRVSERIDQKSWSSDGVEIRHLAALEAVVETGSFGRAGMKLGYSQSAISQQIAALEQAAGPALPNGRAESAP